MNPTSYYTLLSREQLEDGTEISKYRSTSLAAGAWNEGEQHMAPATGIIAAELERFQPREDLRIARISLDILGMIHAGEFEIVTKMFRPGRTIELIESQMITKGRPSIIARAWRLATRDTSDIQGIEDEKIPGVEEAELWDGLKEWPGGFIASLRAKTIEGHRRGKGITWVTTPYDMVEGTHPSSFVRLIGLVDTMNAVVPRVNAHQDRISFPNLDMQIHLLRMPVGEWLGIEGTHQFGADGIGLTSAKLHDADGPFGHAEQILTLREMN